MAASSASASRCTSSVFDAALLDLPLPMADPAALRLAREQCERALDALGTGDGIVVGVRQALRVESRRLPFARRDAVRLGVSPRTLKRRLAESGTSYSALLEDERRARALLLLRSEALSVDEIALRLGLFRRRQLHARLPSLDRASPGALPSQPDGAEMKTAPWGEPGGGGRGSEERRRLGAEARP